MKLKCKVITRASRNEILGLEKLNYLDLEFKNKNGNDENNLPFLKIYLTAVPVDGKANKELIKLILSNKKDKSSMVIEDYKPKTKKFIANNSMVKNNLSEILNLQKKTWRKLL